MKGKKARDRIASGSESLRPALKHQSRERRSLKLSSRGRERDEGKKQNGGSNQVFRKKGTIDSEMYEDKSKGWKHRKWKKPKVRQVKGRTRKSQIKKV